MGVAVGGLHFDYAVTHFENGNIEGPASKIVDGDNFIFLLVQTVGQCRSRGFVDDALHGQSGNLSRVLRGLPLCIVEVSGNRDDRTRHFLSEVVLSRLLHLVEHRGRDFRGGELLIANLYPGIPILAADHPIGDHFHLLGHLVEAAAHEPLD